MEVWLTQESEVLGTLPFDYKTNVSGVLHYTLGSFELHVH